MRNLLAIAAAVAVLPCSGVAFAQQQNPMSYEAIAKAKAGAWAEYTMSMKGQQQQVKMKYAVVEKTDKSLAIEVESATPMGPVLMHMAFEGAPPDAWKMTKMRMQMGTNPAQDMPAAALTVGTIKKGESPGKLVGSEKVTVAGGTFDTKHYTRTLPPDQGGTTLDMWMSDKAVPTGLVKMKDSRGVEGSLTAMGTDAKAKMDMTKPAQQAQIPGGPGGAPPPSAPPAGGKPAPAPAAKPAK
jgi:hypothetical protein